MTDRLPPLPWRFPQPGYDVAGCLGSPWFRARMALQRQVPRYPRLRITYYRPGDTWGTEKRFWTFAAMARERQLRSAERKRQDDWKRVWRGPDAPK